MYIYIYNYIYVYIRINKTLFIYDDTTSMKTVRGVFRTLIYSRMCISYWQGHANCNFMSARNLIKFLSPSV